MDGSPNSKIESDYTIRVPLKMLQLTEKDGKTWPVAFSWKNEDGTPIEVNIDRIISVTPQAEQKSGTVGDCYKCEIEGQIEKIYYTKLTPRKWFKVIPVSEQVYKEYYKLPGE